MKFPKVAFKEFRVFGKKDEAMMHKRLPLAFLVASFFYLTSSRASEILEDANRYTVQVLSSVDYPFGLEAKGTSRGAGFLIDREKGWILTNAHVARRAPARIRVNFKGLASTVVTRTYIDTHLDIAILAMEPNKIPVSASVAKLECDADAQAGKQVIAFGHPWSLDYTATRGIISGTKSFDGVEHLQTDAALNNGNSGGPLIDERTGRIVGVNVSVLNKSQTEGLNFAVPSKLVCTIIKLLAAGKDPSPPAIPVRFAETLKDRELIVAEAKEEWAKALSIGDKVISVNGDTNAVYASRVIDKVRGANSVSVKVLRAGIEHTFALPVTTELKRFEQIGVSVSGLLLSAPLYPDPDRGSVTVQYVDRASLGEQALVRLDDVIHSIDGAVIKSYEDVIAALKGKDGKETEFIVKREIAKERGNYNYLVRRVEIDRVAIVDDRGPRNTR